MAHHRYTDGYSQTFARCATTTGDDLPCNTSQRLYPLRLIATITFLHITLISQQCHINTQRSTVADISYTFTVYLSQVPTPLTKVSNEMHENMTNTTCYCTEMHQFEVVIDGSRAMILLCTLVIFESIISCETIVMF